MKKIVKEHIVSMIQEFLKGMADVLLVPEVILISFLMLLLRKTDILIGKLGGK